MPTIKLTVSHRYARATGVPYFTITNIAQDRVTNPGVLTCQKLLDYFAAEERAA